MATQTVEQAIDSEIAALTERVTALRAMKQMLSGRTPRATRATRVASAARNGTKRVPTAERMAQIHAVLADRGGEMTTTEVASAIGVQRSRTRKILGDMVASKQIKQTTRHRPGSTAPDKFAAK